MIVDQSTPPPEDSPSGAHRGGPGASSLWRTVMGVIRIAVPAGFASLAVIGALVTPPVGMLLVAPLIGLGTGLLVALVNPLFPGEPWPRRGALLTGATAAAFVPFTNGVALLGSTGGVMALVLLVLGSCLAADRMMDFIERDPPDGAVRDDHWLQFVMPSLPTATLLQEWRATRALSSGRRGLAEQTRAVHVRGLLLEELARRDPAAVDRWLSSGDWSSEPRIRPDRDVAG